MGTHYQISIHFGSGQEGQDRVDNIKRLCKLLGFRSQSAFIQDCVDKQVKKYKKELESPVENTNGI